MANNKKFILDWSETGQTVYFICVRAVDSFRLDDADGDFATAPADPYILWAEDSVLKGRYSLSESRLLWNNGLYTYAVYKQAGGSPAPVSDTIIGTGELAITNDTEVNAISLGDLHDEAFGTWTVDPTAKTLTLLKADGSTLKTFDLTSTTATVPSFIVRTPQ